MSLAIRQTITRTTRRTRPSEKKYKHLDMNGVDCSILADNPIPSYKNKFDMNPHFTKDNSDEFICAATFNEQAMNDYISNNTNSDNFKKGLLRRIDANMTPYFFVFESDDLSLDDQLSNIDKILDGPARDVITSVTFSGSKSIHVLAKIPEKYRMEVKKDYKFYWEAAAIYIFQDNSKYLDRACASVSRLTRKPNGIRENGKKQICYYYNKDASLLESQYEWAVPIHNEELRKMELELKEKEQQRLARQDALKDEDEFEKLERMYAKGASGPFEVAYNAIKGICPAGENYVAALISLRSRGFSKEIQERMLENASAAHPTNISKSRVRYLLSHDTI